MADSIIYNKVESLERCLKRIEEDYVDHEQAFLEDYMRQDAVILNLLRACEQSISLANHLANREKLGVPKSSRSAFDLLVKAGILSQTLAQGLKNMVGFRNIATHKYQELDLDVVVAILNGDLDDFRAFGKIALALA